MGFIQGSIIRYTGAEKSAEGFGVTLLLFYGGIYTDYHQVFHLKS